MAGGESQLSGGQAVPREMAGNEHGNAVAAYLAPETATRMAAAARGLIGAVAGNQQVVLNPEFDAFDPRSPRRQWTYLPILDRPGLPLREMSDPQRKLAHELIIASVSMEGSAKVVSIMAMEHVRRALIQVSAPDAAHMFAPERYCFRIFGDPGGPAPWGWQLAGHHVVLNFTVAGNYASPTPCMLGSVPASYGAEPARARRASCCYQAGQVRALRASCCYPHRRGRAWIVDRNARHSVQNYPLSRCRQPGTAVAGAGGARDRAGRGAHRAPGRNPG